MLKTYWRLLGLFILIGLGIIWWLDFCSNGKDALEKRTGAAAMLYEQAFIQKQRSRIWNPLRLQEVLIIDSTRAVFYNPIMIKIAQENIYVLDWAVQKILKIHSTGEYQLAIGNGKGNGPGEFANISDFDISGSYIYVCDPVLGKIDCFDTKTGAYVKTITPKTALDRIHFAANEYYLGKPASASGSLVNLYDSENLLVKMYFADLPWKAGDNLLTDGYLISNRRNFAIFAFYNSGLFCGINMERQESTFLARSIKEHPFPELAALPGGFMLPRGSSTTNFSASAAKDKLYLFSEVIQESATDFSILDVYDLMSGVYRYSLKITGRYKSIQVTDDYIYALTSFAIRKYQWKTDDENIGSL